MILENESELLILEVHLSSLKPEMLVCLDNEIYNSMKVSLQIL